MLLIISGSISSVYAFETSKLQWSEGISDTLERGEVISYNEYSVKVVAFPPPVESDKYIERPSEPVEPYVGLNISKNGSFINTTVLKLDESYISPDGELRVTAKELPSRSATEWLFQSYNPWATIELNPRGIPDLELSVDTDKSKYAPSQDQEIVATVSLENTGSADAFNVDMDIKTELPVKRGSLKYHYEKIGKGESITETITFALPLLTEEKIYSISANTSGYDALDIAYAAQITQIISTAINPEWSMSLRKSTHDKMYLKDSVMVSLSLKNNGKYDIRSVSINDFLPDGFKLVSNVSLQWVVNISAGGEWDYRYLIKPQEPNTEGVLFPPATAQFKVRNELYGIRSNQPKIVVYGPKIVLDKQIDVPDVNPGDTVIVTVTAENTGNTPTKVVIKDQLPEDAALISGSTDYEEFLEANKIASFSYTLKTGSTYPIKLPPATAQYYELGTRGEKISTESQELEIGIKSQDETSTDVPVSKITALPAEPATPVPTIDDSDDTDNSNATDGFDGSGPDEPESVKPSNEIDTFLNSILGCDDNGIDRYGSAYDICDFLRED
ncbi:protein of unknown function DUF11 [Candidatus Methanoperedens nitroreducens]|uniref:DUF11 domain-containing protein n=1 Tax=Candidatus Methanoperedens nitratireducens TaxID=1392998 RepID=A0A062VB11_9EURY|nr:DUF11 domain-containing protein [Candidatus Methanoperedens nitroreducens]KCZ72495.1 protein of unknown function DUF11 [Candidatus Methanoperedens nitroreducens]MDJ1423572.1 DUF11 domain-containing protein [Candidatus Methanoperedens sp.]